MNRCNKCNTELIEQARFCNVCGSPQSPGTHVQISSPTDQETPDKTNHCHKCGSELPEVARFCNICGSAQNTGVSSTASTASENQATLVSESTDNKTVSDTSKPSQSLIPTRSIQPGIKQPSSLKENGDKSIRRKSITRPPVFPARPTYNGVKSPSSPPQQNTLQS